MTIHFTRMDTAEYIRLARHNTDGPLTEQILGAVRIHRQRKDSPVLIFRSVIAACCSSVHTVVVSLMSPVSTPLRDRVLFGDQLIDAGYPDESYTRVDRADSTVADEFAAPPEKLILIVHLDQSQLGPITPNI